MLNMTITRNRKRKESIEIFPKIEDFINYLKENYNNLNFENDIIKSSIFSVYEKLIKADGNVLYLRLSRWLPGQFGFKCANKFSLSFWLERGFNEKDYIEFSKFTFKESSERLTKLAKELKNSLYVYDPSYKNIRFR